MGLVSGSVAGELPIDKGDGSANGATVSSPFEEQFQIDIDIWTTKGVDIVVLMALHYPRQLKERHEMATFRHFTTCGNETVQLKNVYYSGRVSAKAKDFSGTCPACGQIHTAERKIERKPNPSNHKCDARCLNAKGFRCECSCGGKNHGAAA